jgi:hypothetical protein
MAGDPVLVPLLLGLSVEALMLSFGAGDLCEVRGLLSCASEIGLKTMRASEGGFSRLYQGSERDPLNGVSEQLCRRWVEGWGAPAFILARSARSLSGRSGSGRDNVLG